MPSATIHQGFASLATRLINKHGRAMQLVVKTNTGTDLRPSYSFVATDIVGVQTKFKKSEIDGTSILSTDKKILVDSAVTLNKETMTIKDGESTYKIEDFEEVKPGMTSCLYKIQAR